MNHNKGFTLIELLVVIAIIALLLSILMPALRKVKDQGRSVVCRSNLHQWYICMNLYESDYDGTFWPGYSPPTIIMWWTAMRVYHEDDNDIRCCPNAAKPPFLIADGAQVPGPGYNREPPFRAWGQMDFPGWDIDADHGSFGCNGWLSNAPPQGVTRDVKYWRKMAKITTPSRVPYMFDAQWTDNWLEPDDGPQPAENTTWDSPEGQTTQWTRVIQNRHGGGTQNAAFMDGANRKVGLKEMWTFKWYISYDTRGIWTKAGGATKDRWPDWMRGFTDY